MKTIDENKSKFSNPRKIKSHQYTSRRQTALNEFKKGNSVRLLRIGDNFIDGLNTFFSNDDRGKSYAIWKYHSEHKFHEHAELFFSINYIIEGDIDYAFQNIRSFEIEESSNLKLSLKRKMDSYFKPIYEKIWIDTNLEIIVDDSLLVLLNLPFKKNTDSNFTLVTWKTMERLKFFQTLNWDNLIDNIKVKGKNYICNSKYVLENIKDAEKSFSTATELINAQNKARIQYSEGDRKDYEIKNSEIEKETNLLIKEGIEKPKISIDTFGVIFLSNQKLPSKYFYKE